MSSNHTKNKSNEQEKKIFKLHHHRHHLVDDLKAFTFHYRQHQLCVGTATSVAASIKGFPRIMIEHESCFSCTRHFKFPKKPNWIETFFFLFFTQFFHTHWMEKIKHESHRLINRSFVIKGYTSNSFKDFCYVVFQIYFEHLIV